MDEMREIIDEFLDETGELLDSVMADVMDLETKADPETINRIYRVFHSIKGNAAMLGFERLGALGHRAEDVLFLVRDAKLAADRTTINALLQSLDMMSLIMDDLREGGADDRDTDAVLQTLQRILDTAGGRGACASGPKPCPDDVSAPAPVRNVSAAPSVSAPIVNSPVASASGIVFDLDSPEVVSSSSAEPPETRTDSVPKHEDACQSRTPLNILIVEDDFSCRQILSTFLCEFGDCHVAKDGLEAIQAVAESYERSQPYDLICMDVMMPKMDGLMSTKTIREIERGKGVAGTEREAAIIITSAVNDPATIIRACYECGANYYFVKPLDFTQMKRQMFKMGLTAVDQSSEFETF